MNAKSILTVVIAAMLLITIVPMGVSAASYDQLNSKLVSTFTSTWIPPTNQWRSASYNEGLDMYVLFWHQDPNTGSVGPRMTWDSAGSTEGNNYWQYTLSNGEYFLLGGTSTVDAASGSYPLHIYATYHQATYPYMNAISPSAETSFTVS